MDDEWDWDHDGEVVDLDGCEATGDPQLDIYGYQSPTRRGQNLTGFTSSNLDWLARSREGRAHRQAKREAQRQAAAARRAPVEANKAETRQPVATRQQPDRLAPHVEQAVEAGAPGREAGWWRVDIAADGSAQWAKVDAPGDGPRITATTPPAPARWQPPAPQWQPVEMTEPSPDTRAW
jgi:hypothetical protein